MIFWVFTILVGDLSREIMAQTSEKAEGWTSTFGGQPLAVSPVHVGAGVCQL